MMMGYLVFWGGQLLGLFLLGGWFVRSGAIAQPEQHARLFHAWLRWGCLPVGMAMMGRVDVDGSPPWRWASAGLRGSAAMCLAMAGGVLMCLGYLAWIVRGLQSPAWRARLAALAPAGRMALTNYLVQSIVCTFIFSGYGLGYFEQLPRAWQVPFVLGLLLAAGAGEPLVAGAFPLRPDGMAVAGGHLPAVAADAPRLIRAAAARAPVESAHERQRCGSPDPGRGRDRPGLRALPAGRRAARCASSNRGAWAAPRRTATAARSRPAMRRRWPRRAWWARPCAGCSARRRRCTSSRAGIRR